MRFTLQIRIFLKRTGLIVAFCAAIFTVTTMALRLGTIANAPTVGFGFLILVLLSAFFADLPVAIITSIVAALCFNFFFLPPVGTFYIAAPDDWISLAAFLLTAIAISRLTASAREHSLRIRELNKTLEQFQEFGGWLLATPPDRLSLSSIAEEAVRLFSLEYCSIHVYSEGKWHHHTGAARSDIARQVADRLKFDEDHPTNLMELVDENALGVRYAQINQGAAPLAALAVRGDNFPEKALGTLAYLISVRLMEALQGPHDLSMKLGIDR